MDNRSIINVMSDQNLNIAVEKKQVKESSIVYHIKPFIYSEKAFNYSLPMHQWIFSIPLQIYRTMLQVHEPFNK